MDVREVYEEAGALLHGHFLLSSGNHSDHYLQSAKVMENPAAAEKLGKGLAEMIRENGIQVDTVCSPALGGILAGYELARALGVRFIFTERVGGDMTLRRGFEIEAGQKILIAEDVVTTGKSSEESAAVLERLGGTIVALACVVDRRAPEVQLRWPLFPACRVSVANWEASDCDLCKQHIPFIKPGSRKFTSRKAT